MFEMSEIFKVMKETKKESRKKRLDSANLEGWTKRTEYHYSRLVNGVKINYWPSSGLCMIGNKKHDINSKCIRDLLNS